MRFHPFIFGLATLAIMCQTGCSPQRESEKLSELTLEGVWRSSGYGEVLEIIEGRYEIYEVTALSCLSRKTGTIAEYDFEINATDDRLTIVEGFDRYTYTRQTDVPNVCRPDQILSATSDPLINYDVFAQTIEEHYAYFNLSDVNWSDYRAKMRARAAEISSDGALLVLFETMLEDLKDGHGGIYPLEDVERPISEINPEPTNENPLRDYGDFEIANIVATHHLGEDAMSGNALVRWGEIAPQIGYIQVNAMFLYARFPELQSRIDEVGFFEVYEEQKEVLPSRDFLDREMNGAGNAMKEAVGSLMDTDMIVLDIRFNGGGLDEVGLAMLTYFNDARRQVATKQAQMPSGSLTPPLLINLLAADAPYTKPVLLFNVSSDG